MDIRAFNKTVIKLFGLLLYECHGLLQSGEHTEHTFKCLSWENTLFYRKSR